MEGTHMTNPNIPASPGGGMPKWVIALIVVILVIVLGCCGGIATCFWAAKKVSQAAPGFVKEQMKKNGVELNLPDASGTAPLPSNFPSDVPVYTGAKTVASSADLKKDNGEATCTTPDSAANVHDFYDKQMSENGWKGESTTTTGATTLLTYSKDNRIATINITGTEKGASILIGYGKK
jgi:hypothetical protein